MTPLARASARTLTQSPCLNVRAQWLVAFSPCQCSARMHQNARTQRPNPSSRSRQQRHVTQKRSHSPPRSSPLPPPSPPLPARSETEERFPQLLTTLIVDSGSVDRVMTVYQEHALAFNPIHLVTVVVRLSKLQHNTDPIDDRLVTFFGHLSIGLRHFDWELAYTLLWHLVALRQQLLQTASVEICHCTERILVQLVQQIHHQHQQQQQYTVSQSVQLLAALALVYHREGLVLPELVQLVDGLYQRLTKELCTSHPRRSLLTVDDVTLICRAIIQLQQMVRGSDNLSEINAQQITKVKLESAGESTDPQLEAEGTVNQPAEARQHSCPAQPLDASLVAALATYLLARPALVTQLQVSSQVLCLSLLALYPQIADHSLITAIGDSLVKHCHVLHQQLQPKNYSQILRSFRQSHQTHPRLLHVLTVAMLHRLRGIDDTEFRTQYAKWSYVLLVDYANLPPYPENALTHEWFARTLTLLSEQDTSILQYPRALSRLLISIVSHLYHRGPAMSDRSIVRMQQHRSAEEHARLRHLHEEHHRFILQFLADSLQTLDTLYCRHGAAEFAAGDWYRLSLVLAMIRADAPLNDWQCPPLSSEFVTAIWTRQQRGRYLPPLFAAEVERTLQSMGVKYHSPYVEPNTGMLADLCLDPASSALDHCDWFDARHDAIESGGVVTDSPSTPVLVVLTEDKDYLVGRCRSSIVRIPELHMRLHVLQTTDQPVLALSDREWRALATSHEKQEFLRTKLAAQWQKFVQFRARKQQLRRRATPDTLPADGVECPTVR